VAAERLALLRCQPWLLAVPVHLQRLSLASSCFRVVPPRPARGGGGDKQETATNEIFYFVLSRKSS
jgi:hypothetical protein